MRFALVKTFVLVLMSVSVIISSYALCNANFNSINSMNFFKQQDEMRMEQQKLYWQDKILMDYRQSWGEFTAIFDNKTMQLEVDNGGSGLVTIHIDHPAVNISDRSGLFDYHANNTWTIYTESYVWFCTTINAPENISFNITVMKDLEGFKNPFYEDNDVWEYNDRVVNIEVKM